MKAHSPKLDKDIRISGELSRSANLAFMVLVTIRSSLVKSTQELPVGHSERLMTVRIPIERSDHMTIFSAYVPTLASTEETKDEFYASLSVVLHTVEQGDKLILMGDFNA